MFPWIYSCGQTETGESELRRKSHFPFHCACHSIYPSCIEPRALASYRFETKRQDGRRLQIFQANTLVPAFSHHSTSYAMPDLNRIPPSHSTRGRLYRAVRLTWSTILGTIWLYQAVLNLLIDTYTNCFRRIVLIRA